MFFKIKVSDRKRHRLYKLNVGKEQAVLLLVWQRATTVHDLGFKDTAGSVKIQNYNRAPRIL